MKCTRCNTNEATTHYKSITNGVVDEMYLCDKCTDELGVLDDLKIDSIFDDFIVNRNSVFNTLMGVDRCSYCGSSLEDIINSGHVGCAYCYEKFGDNLCRNIKKIHGNTKHVGKCISSDSNNQAAERINQLKSDLKQAVINQNFEQAVILRDQIKSLEEEA